ncbi:MAG: DUF1622 domain-containing protein [Hyphomicrobiales bacterium]|nr:DUF1622 domain-containing protein [Hyphomicrobiales bacterium]
MEVIAFWMETFASWVKIGFEAASIVVVAAGGIVLLVVFVRGASSGDWISKLRPTLSPYLLLALELQLASDIVGTAIAPTLEQIGKLAAIAVIRTFLNYFLEAEVKEASKHSAEIDQGTR